MQGDARREETLAERASSARPPRSGPSTTRTRTFRSRSRRANSHPTCDSARIGDEAYERLAAERLGEEVLDRVGLGPVDRPNRASSASNSASHASNPVSDGIDRTCVPLHTSLLPPLCRLAPSPLTLAEYTLRCDVDATFDEVVDNDDLDPVVESVTGSPVMVLEGLPGAEPAG